MVRLARLDDLDAVNRIVRGAYSRYVERLGMEPGPMLDDYGQRIKAGQAWVIEDAGSVAGLLVLVDADRALLLDNIAVDPAAQGRGLGKMLMTFVEDEARRRGRAEVQLYTNVLMIENVALYQRLGFSETNRVTEKGYQRVYMTKALS